MSINATNFALATVWTTVVAPQTVASANSANGTAVNLTGTNGNEIGFVVIAGSVGGGTVAAKLQYSDNGSSWTDAGYSLTLSAAGTAPISIGRSIFGHDYVRVVLTTTGTNATVAAAYTAYQLMEAPDPAKVAGTDYLAVGN